MGEDETMGAVSRRRFLGLTAGAGGALLLATAGCAGPGGASAAPDDLSEGRDRRLRIDNWADYIDPDAEGTVARFQAATDIAVTYEEEYADNLTALADGGVIHQLQEGQGSLYDVIVPTYWVVKRLLARGLLEPIPLERIPNHVNVDPLFLEVPWDRGARWHMPWQAGLTGIASDPAATGGKPVTSVAQLVNDPALKGRVGMVTEMREVVGLLLLARGQDPARVTADQARAALDDLQAIVSKGQVKYFTGSEFGELLPNKTFAACLAWSGDAVQIQATRPDLRFAIPDEGGMQWFDTMCIAKGSPNRVAAAKWMNFVYDPENAARITSWVQYISPVKGVKDVLIANGGEDAELAENVLLFPDAATNERLKVFGELEQDDEIAVQTRFNEITG